MVRPYLRWVNSRYRTNVALRPLYLQHRKFTLGFATAAWCQTRTFGRLDFGQLAHDVNGRGQLNTGQDDTVQYRSPTPCPVTNEATSLPVIGPSLMPRCPWPNAYTTALQCGERPMIGSESGVDGLCPILWRLTRSLSRGSACCAACSNLSMRAKSGGSRQARKFDAASQANTIRSWVPERIARSGNTTGRPAELPAASERALPASERP